MSATSNLAERLKKQKELESETFQRLTNTQLTVMRNELNSILQHELDTIKAGLVESNKTLTWRIFKNRMFWPSVMGLSLCLGLSLGAWGIGQYANKQIQTVIVQKNTLKQIEAKTFGLRLLEDRNGQFIVLPPDYKVEGGWKVGKLPALKLVKE